MAKLFTLASVNGASLTGANLKATLVALFNALKTSGISPNSRAAITGTATLTTDQCGLVLVDATAGSMVLTLPVSGADTDDAIYMLRRIDATTNTVTIRRNGTDTIEGGSADQFLPPVAGAVMELQMPAGATNWRIVTLTGGTQAGARATLGFPLRGFIAGLTLSTAGSSATFSVAAGEAADSTNAFLLQLASALAKTTSAWAVGNANGGLDTGAIANSTWYHVYLIRRPDTGVVDVVFSLSASVPTLPTNYTQYRRIGAMKTNGSAQWTKFVQDGDCFQWDTPVQDVNASAAGTAAVTRTLSTPPGVRTEAMLIVHVNDAGSVGEGVYISDLSTADLAGSNTTAPGFTVQVIAGGATNGSGQVRVRTNTSAQIRSRCAVGTASQGMRINTCGWIDSRGRDA